MANHRILFELWKRLCAGVGAVYRVLAPRAWSAIIYGALFCSLSVKFYHAARYGLIREYPSWILTDVAVLLGLEVVLSLACYRWPASGRTSPGRW